MRMILQISKSANINIKTIKFIIWTITFLTSNGGTINNYIVKTDIEGGCLWQMRTYNKPTYNNSVPRMTSFSWQDWKRNVMGYLLQNSEEKIYSQEFYFWPKVVSTYTTFWKKRKRAIGGLYSINKADKKIYIYMTQTKDAKIKIGREIV